MKRGLALGLLLFVVVLSSFSFHFSYDLFDALNNCDVSFDILESNEDNQVVMISCYDFDEISNSLKLEECFKEYISDRVVIEGYSHKLNNYIVVNNRKVNIQISQFDGCCIIGYPLINNSF